MVPLVGGLSMKQQFSLRVPPHALVSGWRESRTPAHSSPTWSNANVLRDAQFKTCSGADAGGKTVAASAVTGSAMVIATGGTVAGGAGAGIATLTDRCHWILGTSCRPPPHDHSTPATGYAACASSYSSSLLPRSLLPSPPMPRSLAKST